VISLLPVFIVAGSLFLNHHHHHHHHHHVPEELGVFPVP